MRQWGREKPHGQSLWWPVVARNKKSVDLDLRTPGGPGRCPPAARARPTCWWRTSGRARWSAGASARTSCGRINPRLIITRVSGYGQTGPYAPRAGFGSIGEAMGGLRYVIGEPDRPPSRAGISIGDSLAATYACMGTLVALHDRERSGRGQVVDSAIYEAVLAMMESWSPEWAVAGYQRERTGAILPNMAPSNVYPTGDGDLVLIAANQDSVFRPAGRARWARPELADDPRYATHGARGATMTELDDLIAAWTGTLDRRRAAGPAGRRRRAGRPDLPGRGHAAPTRTSSRGRRSSDVPTRPSAS